VLGLRIALLMVGIVLVAVDSLHRVVAEEGHSESSASEVLGVLGDGVVGDSQPARPLGDPATLARWERGEWKYRITAGPRRGKTESETLSPIAGSTSRGETWARTIGQDYTLHLSRAADGSLFMASEIAQIYNVLVLFEPPLSYLIAGLSPGERRLFDGAMEIYASRKQSNKLYSGRIQAVTVYDGVYRITVPAGTFNAVLIRTDYQIDVLALVSVKDTLYTFYAEGVGKVAEAEHRRISAKLFTTDTKTGRVLLSFTVVVPPPPPPPIQAP